jgi:hypothetical protein
MRFTNKQLEDGDASTWFHASADAWYPERAQPGHGQYLPLFFKFSGRAP